ncbi:MAG: tRNA lysidine(34) synthetase TilS [Longicatena sp.]
MENFKLETNEKYIIGVSGGPDSMALLNMCREQGIRVIVVHMNYQKRVSAQRDMDIVQAYCERYDIPFECRKQNKVCKGNFQAFAREERYAFYKEILEKYQAKGVLLAHHLDDHLETYLMQKQRHSIGEYLGIQEETRIMGCLIIRVLLDQTKAELEAYCYEKSVPFGVDESNLSNDYTRNKIRHTIIDQMSMKEKQVLKAKIEEENAALKVQREGAKRFLESWDNSIADLQKLSLDKLEQVLVQYIKRECNCYLSYAQIKELRELILHSAHKWTKDIKTTYDIYSEYGKLCIDTKAKISYAYTYDKVKVTQTPYFAISLTGDSTSALSLQSSDYPITIRNVRENDEIRLRFGKKKINRWFIDRKIPKKERKSWPVVVNAVGNVILVPKIGCDIEHFSNNPTLFVLK